MPIPFILAGMAAAAGAAGVVKEGKAISKNSQAKDLVSRAQYIYDSAKEQLESQRQTTAKDLNALGELKLNIWSNEIQRFLNLFGKFKRVDIKGEVKLNNIPEISDTDSIKTMQMASLKAVEIMKGGVASLGARGSGRSSQLRRSYDVRKRFDWNSNCIIIRSCCYKCNIGMVWWRFFGCRGIGNGRWSFRFGGGLLPDLY